PSKTVATLSESSPRIYCPIVPLSANYSTPIVRAASGGTFDLEGLGRIHVSPNVLAQDCVLRLIPMPMESWAHGLLEGIHGENILCDHLWLHIVDPAGQPLPGSTLLASGGVTLVRKVAFMPAIPEGSSPVEWRVHHLGETFGQDIAHPADVARDMAVYALAVGHNCLTSTYTLATGGCVAFPWQIEYVHKTTRKEVMGCTFLSCGRHTANQETKVANGETRETSHSLSAEAAKEAGFEGSAGFAKIAAKSSFKIQGSFENTTTRTTLYERSIAITSGQAASNETNAACTDALCCMGLLYVTYEVWARQYTICGAPATNSKKIGEMEVCVGLCTWFENIAWNPNCPGCAQDGTPASLPGPNSFVF
ncbi:MAG: hypothetical protein KF830_16525, partial [Planctomycetes bacterium]|nr:hypothetical protein [Planctomycetota bacterium]